MMAGIPLPRWSYLPGGDHKPDRMPLDLAKARVPARFEAFVPVEHGAFLYGVVLNDGGFHWEAHEVLEAVWKAAPMNGPDRLALQALIQIANAGLKQRMNRSRAAARLVQHAGALLGELALRRRLADERSLAERLRFEALEEQINRWAPGTRLYLTPALAFEEEQKCINTAESRWTVRVLCTILQDKNGETHGG